MKKYKPKFALALIVLFLFLPLSSKALNSDDAYKGIVKIYTYHLDSDNFVTAAQTGSGVIIDESGIILTNHHVVTVENEFDNEESVGYMICLTNDSTSKPECEYSADLISKDKDKDIALLKIKKINGLSEKSSFSSIERVVVDSFTEGNATKALGYPGIGGDTITITSGTISGITEKYSLKWIKTDTPFSFGSSGGALINSEGKLIGITTSAHSDMLGSLGYVINITSLNSWVNSVISNAPQVSKIKSNVDTFIKNRNDILSGNKYTNKVPKIEMIKPEGWEFEFNSENYIKINNPNTSEGGSVNIILQKTVLENNLISINTEIKMIKLLMRNSIMTIIGDEEKIISGIKGKKIIQSLFDEEVFQVLLPIKNYRATISYYYGKENKDKDMVDEIINSIVISGDNVKYQEKRDFKYENPYFKLKTTGDWVLSEANSAEIPLVIGNKNEPAIEVLFNIKKMSENMIGMTNQEYFDYFKNNELVKSSIDEVFELKGDRYFDTVSYAINDELDDDIFYKYRFKDEEDDDLVKYFGAGYRIIDGDRAIVIQFSYMGEDENKFESYLEDFKENVLKNLTLGREVTEKVINQKQEVSQEQENTKENNNVVPTKLKIKSFSNSFSKKLIGRILLKVEDNGEAWYMSPHRDSSAYYLGRPEDAFEIMRRQGVGITNSDLEKIPLGMTSSTEMTDSDGDGLPDMMEDSIGTDKNNPDTDADGFDDKTEALNGYNPKGEGKVNLQLYFSEIYKGKIYIQVEGAGEAWYVSPSDGKRYFLGRPADAYSVMRELSLGITNEDFEKIE